MTIPKLTPYTGQVANPDGSQTQTEFTQNMFGQLSYEAQLATELDATIDGMNNAVDEVEANSVKAENAVNTAEALLSENGYQGLWPDTGGSANKGETWQTQVGGVPTGDYFTALQNTTVNPVGDNVNWKAENDYGDSASGLVVQHKRLTQSELETYILADGEMARNKDDGSLHVGDGVTLGGIKQKDFLSIKQLGAKGDGISDDSNALVAASNYQGIVVFPVGTYKISSDIQIPNTVSFKFSRGAILSVDSGITLTIDAEIDAGYYQIFSGDGDVLPTYLKTDTPVNLRSKTDKVKLAWFGVNGDVFVSGNYGSSLPAAALGDMPTGTDSTGAFKKAMKFVEWGSMHGSKYLVQRSRMTLVGTPNTAILVKGDGIFKQQAYATELAAVYALADSGSAFLSSTEFQTAKFSDWQFNVDMQDGHIFWQPLTATDEFISAEYMLNRCEFRRMRMTPCGITTGQMGVFFHNRSATYYDGSGNVVEWMNSLGWPTFEDCEITFGELSPPQLGTYAPQVGIDTLFLFTGFGRGDRPNFKRCIFTQFKKVIRCENSQAVEVNFDSGCELRTEIDGAVFFDYASFAGQFKLDGTGVFLKGANQTLLRTAIEDNRADFTDSAEFSMSNIRMEGGANRHTLIDVEAGRINLEGFTHNYAMSNTTEVNACDMRISGTAEVFAKSAGVPGVILFDEYDSGKIKSVPALTADGVRFSGADGLDKVSYIIGGVTKSMPRAIAQGNEIPWVSLSNTPTILGADVIESPASYGGRNAKGGKAREVTLTATDYSVNGEAFYLPSWCVVESMKVTRRSTDITQFAKIRTTVNATGNAIANDYAFPSNDGEYLAEMLPSTTFLTVPTNDKGKRKINFTVLDTSDQGVSGGPLMSVTIKYRSLMTWSECPNSGLQSDPEFITL